jgi:hypothetical protein
MRLLLSKHLHPECDSPLCCSEVLLKSVTDAQLYPQMPPIVGMFEAPG